MSSFGQYSQQPSTTGQSIAASVDATALRTYVQRVYAWMVGGLMVTSVTAIWLGSNPELLLSILSGPLFWLAVLGPIAMVWFLTARIDSMKPSTAAGMFLAYSLLNGIAFSSIFLIYELGSIFQVFLIAAVMYGVAAVYGYTTKRDLTNWGAFLFMGVIGLLVTMVVNWFLQSPAVTWAFSLVGVVIFTGLTAYDMQRIKEQAVVMYAGDALSNKRAIIGALSLYLNFINIFLFLLRLLGNRR
ncbi:MAG: Bax inhibitor-1/YccA family protein [Bradyrhizobiaceae bacterium]|nr:Bax inhibitor-1/YccA family protein [Bradyrhizobiaceae bacterium]